MLESLAAHEFENPLRLKFSKDFFAKIPTKPGVYFMFDDAERILYIGKAKCLRKRLSSYRNAKPGKVQDHTLELLECVGSLRWMETRSEKSALSREAKLIRTFRPPYNIAGTEPDRYLYIGFKLEAENISFRLSSVDISREYNDVFGCFSHRRAIKLGYTALIRLIHAASSKDKRFSFPARITRPSPPWRYTMKFPKYWIGDLQLFLFGSSENFLKTLTLALLENENIPRFMYSGIQNDLQIAHNFFKIGPQATFKLRTRLAIGSLLLTPTHMERLRNREARKVRKEFSWTLPPVES